MITWTFIHPVVTFLSCRLGGNLCSKQCYRCKSHQRFDLIIWEKVHDAPYGTHHHIEVHTCKILIDCYERANQDKRPRLPPFDNKNMLLAKYLTIQIHFNLNSRCLACNSKLGPLLSRGVLQLRVFYFSPSSQPPHSLLTYSLQTDLMECFFSGH